MVEKKTYSVRINPEIMKAARILAVEKETTLSDLVEEAVQEYMKKNRQEARKPTKK